MPIQTRSQHTGTAAEIGHKSKERIQKRGKSNKSSDKSSGNVQNQVVNTPKHQAMVTKMKDKIDHLKQKELERALTTEEKVELQNLEDTVAGVHSDVFQADQMDVVTSLPMTEEENYQATVQSVSRDPSIAQAPNELDATWNLMEPEQVQKKDLGSPQAAQKTVAAPNLEDQEKPQSARAQTITLTSEDNIEWEVPANPHQLQDEGLVGIETKVVGHMRMTSGYRYLVRYGDSKAWSLKFATFLPPTSNYIAEDSKDVVSKKNRILERIINATSRKNVPIEIMNQVKILGIYWNNKSGVGRGAEVDILKPGSPAYSRDTVRCHIYLDPSLYKDQANEWMITNLSGYSHETRTVVKQFLPGNSPNQRDRQFFNEAVRLEERFGRGFEHLLKIKGELLPLKEEPAAEETAATPTSGRNTRYARSKQPRRYNTRSQANNQQRYLDPQSPQVESSTLSISPSVQEIISEFHEFFTVSYGLPQGTKVPNMDKEMQGRYFEVLGGFLEARKRKPEGGGPF
jgi:hypothetical protein